MAATPDDPALAEPRRRLAAATTALRTGRFAEGWPLYEARRELPWIDVPTPLTPAPEWRGEDPQGLRIAVCAEQGWGDQLMFGRYLGWLRERGADPFVVCHPKLARVFERCGYWTKPYLLDRPLPAADAWTVFGSLPFRLGVSAPPPPAYVTPRQAGPGGGVGVVTTGNRAHLNDRHRSLTGAEAGRLLALGRDLLPEATGLYDFSDTADLIAALDLVITVDTAVAHLAGAMGKPTWILLPFSGLDWRWADGVRTPWYPHARLFRQPAADDWASVLDAVETALAASPDAA